mmetsp:Transcript_43347/g.81228  ORF Transcript_43347/g.81228 Transcript_43347/m.81228 type:complete len:239 (+) Transcript_43347:2442-3158(+)
MAKITVSFMWVLDTLEMMFRTVLLNVDIVGASMVRLWNGSDSNSTIDLMEYVSPLKLCTHWSLIFLLRNSVWLSKDCMWIRRCSEKASIDPETSRLHQWNTAMISTSIIGTSPRVDEVMFISISSGGMPAMRARPNCIVFENRTGSISFKLKSSTMSSAIVVSVFTGWVGIVILVALRNVAAHTRFSSPHRVTRDPLKTEYGSLCSTDTISSATDSFIKLKGTETTIVMPSRPYLVIM